MILLCGTFCSPDELAPRLTKAVLLDILMMPLFTWHNLREEMLREGVPEPGFAGRGIFVELEEATEWITVGLEYSSVVEALAPLLDKFKGAMSLFFRDCAPFLPPTPKYHSYKELIERLLEK
jgi:hypothetical protein